MLLAKALCVRANSVSNAAFAGFSPCTPKSSVVFTRPIPKKVCHSRFTVTRAVRGFSRAMSHRAKPSDIYNWVFFKAFLHFKISL